MSVFYEDVNTRKHLLYFVRVFYEDVNTRKHLLYFVSVFYEDVNTRKHLRNFVSVYVGMCQYPQTPAEFCERFCGDVNTRA